MSAFDFTELEKGLTEIDKSLKSQDKEVKDLENRVILKREELEIIEKDLLTKRRDFSRETIRKSKLFLSEIFEFIKPTIGKWYLGAFSDYFYILNIELKLHTSESLIEYSRIELEYICVRCQKDSIYISKKLEHFNYLNECRNFYKTFTKEVPGLPDTSLQSMFILALAKFKSE